MPRSAVQGRTFAKVPRPARRRWKAEDAGAVLKRLESSGLSVGEFAARENLSAPRLYRWRGRLRAVRPKTAAFVEITPAAATIELVLRSGDVVRLPDGFSEDALRRLVAVLDERDAGC